VILAMGHLPFRYVPPAISHLPKELVSHSSDHSDLSRFAGKDVTIIGCGQSALETAALLREAGASVRVLARAPSIEWNADIRPTDSLIERWFNPDGGLGPGWRNVAKSELPRLFWYLPIQVRHRVVAKANGPAGSWWLKDRLIGKVPMLIAREIISATEHKGRLRLSVRSGVRAEQFSTDHVIAGTGYKVDVSRLSPIDEMLRSNIKTFEGAPVLNSVFESSVPGLHFVGLPSALSFGPVMRFVYGTKHAAAILTPHIRSATRQTSRPLRATAGDRIPQPQDI
jgi:FAD-dependent urate hydroxylase